MTYTTSRAMADERLALQFPEVVAQLVGGKQHVHELDCGTAGYVQDRSCEVAPYPANSTRGAILKGMETSAESKPMVLLVALPEQRRPAGRGG